ncbi:MAG: MoaD family protein [Chloroflexi bacterium]|jgi:molybdopterin synthase sulfur carrier subunit|nr:MoaD family protein [Chloroflexota bacterium]GIW11533.1 MAG: MoaD family protein [Dehalococcoidia bacterium]
MATIRVRIPAALRAQTNEQSEVEVTAEDVRGVIDALDRQFPGIGTRLRDDQGELRRFVNIYVNGEDVRFLAGLQTPIRTGDEVSIIPAVAGG